jgi:hypothetical protein
VAKKSGVTRLDVASKATAFAPFSQKLKACASFFSGHAQPGQSKPVGWLILRSVMAPFLKTSCRFKFRATLNSAPQPPAGLLYGSIRA